MYTLEGTLVYVTGVELSTMYVETAVLFCGMLAYTAMDVPIGDIRSRIGDRNRKEAHH